MTISGGFNMYKKISAPFSFLARLFLSFALLGVLVSCGGKKDADSDGERLWNITMIKYEELQQTEDAEQGFRQGLLDAGLKEGFDYVIQSRSAQGDIPTVMSMLDAAAADGTDMIVSLQTPTLNAAVQRGVGIPLVFMVVANPFVISNVGQNDTVHLPYLTGVYTHTTFESMIGHVQACLPEARKIGTLYASAELNGVFYRTALHKAVAAAGLEFEAIGVVSRDGVGAMAELLCNSGVDAICQIEDNLTSAAFPALIRAARAANVPVFSFVNKQAEQGAILTLAPDYTVGAVQAARLAARIIRGENPENIPFQRVSKFDLIVNHDAARAAGITIPESVTARADHTIAAKTP
jgi:ABC-type uncharacterized transport system substrate-binding protein